MLAACPLHAQWLDGEPISDVMAMGGIIDRYRRLIEDGRPVATGVALLGDAWACTNPSLGRGVTMGLLHARRLRDVVRSHLGDPREFAETWDAVTEPLAVSSLGFSQCRCRGPRVGCRSAALRRERSATWVM